jgi:2-polyprenyl-6-methoxyphenol hydroxylase-like FAD-dependent oxidoreductase
VAHYLHTSQEDIVYDGTVLDKILVDAAVAAGVELRERFAVEELVTDGQRVTGIRGRMAGGATVVENARIVIGADGVYSRVGKMVKVPEYAVKPSPICAYYSYWSGVPVDGVELYPRPGRMIAAGATNDEQTLVIVYWPKSLFHQVRRDIEREFLDAISLVPGLAERLRGGERTEPFRGTGDLPFYLPSRTGPAGPSSAMPATTRTPSPRKGSQTRSAMPTSSRRLSTRASRAA